MSVHPDQPDYSVPTLGPISKESRREWRSLLWNDNGIEDGTVPAKQLFNHVWEGKFFPRGCRGKIERFEIYCIGTIAPEITLAFSPEPGMGELGTVTITPGAAWAWQSAIWRQFWNYDSLFIWIKELKVNVWFAYDEQAPYDAHIGDAAFAIWRRLNRRYFIRAVYDSETAGDVPVSGTINNVKIPSSCTDFRAEDVPVDNMVWTELVNIQGAGHMLRFHIWINAVGDGVASMIRVTTDGVVGDIINHAPAYYDAPPLKVFQTVDPFHHHYVCYIPYEFRRSLKLEAYQGSGVQKLASYRVSTALIR